MLINRISGAKEDDKMRRDLLAALDLKNDWAVPAWPLPNMKPSTEKSFWGWRASYTFPLEVWAGQIRIGNEWANLMLYWVGHSQFIDGGFAVAVFRQYREERVEYYEWGACDHDFEGKNAGRCLTKYTCKKCHKTFEIDSSD